VQRGLDVKPTVGRKVPPGPHRILQKRNNGVVCPEKGPPFPETSSPGHNPRKKNVESKEAQS